MSTEGGKQEPAPTHLWPPAGFQLNLALENQHPLPGATEKALKNS